MVTDKKMRDEWQRLSDAVADKSGHERGCMTETLADAVPALLQDLAEIDEALEAATLPATDEQGEWTFAQRIRQLGVDVEVFGNGSKRSREDLDVAVRAVAALTAERDAATKRADDQYRSTIAAMNDKSAAWVQVWERLNAHGMMNFVGGNGNGITRALAFISHLASEGNSARSERDASITACEKLSKELQAARADRDEDRFLLGEVNAEVARLREENAALGGHLLSLGVERDRDVSRATNALGRAHAALRQQVITADTHGSCSLCETKWTKNEWHRNGCVLADPAGRAAAEYVAALEKEHEAAGIAWAHVSGTDARENLYNANAVVEALRGGK